MNSFCSSTPRNKNFVAMLQMLLTTVLVTCAITIDVSKPPQQRPQQQQQQQQRPPQQQQQIVEDESLLKSNETLLKMIRTMTDSIMIDGDFISINKLKANISRNFSKGGDDNDDDDGGGDDDEGKEPCHSHLFFIIIYGPLFGIVCGLGILGNTLSFAVLHADPPMRYTKNFRPRLADQSSMDPSVRASRDSNYQPPSRTCSCCCSRQRRKSYQRSFHKRSNNSRVTSVSMVAVPTSENFKSIISTAILKRVSNSRQNVFRGRRIKGQSVSSYLLKALAITDNVYLATSAFVQIYSAVAIYFGREKEFEKIFYYLQKYFWPINYLAQLGTVWMMVLVAANRYIAVCKPLHASRLCTKSKVRRQILILGVSLVIYNMPRFFEYDYRPVISVNGTICENQCTVNHGLVNYHLYNILYENVAYCLVAFFLPLSVLVFFNVRLMATLRSAEKFRPSQFTTFATTSTTDISNIVSPDAGKFETSGKTRYKFSFSPITPAPHRQSATVLYSEHQQSKTRSSVPKIASESIFDENSVYRESSTTGAKASTMPRTGSKVNDALLTSIVHSKIGAGKSPVNADERNVTLVMIIIILSFIVCETPAAINQILFYLVDKEARGTCSSYMMFYHVSNLLIVLNSALNFFVYFLFRKKFQTQLWSLVCRKNTENDEMTMKV